MGVGIAFTDVEREENNLFPNMITQSEPAETGETMQGKSELRPRLAASE